MSDTNTGGPAFPVVTTHESYVSAEGMTLRDYFAAKALQGLVGGAGYNEPINLHGAAEWSYNMADAMLKARAS